MRDEISKSLARDKSKALSGLYARARRYVAIAPIVAILAMLSMMAPTAAKAAIITANSLADPGESGICALRDAISAANTETAVNGCAAGTGNNANSAFDGFPV